MQTETSPVVANLISSVLSEMLDENGALKRKASVCSPCCCSPGCYTAPPAPTCTALCYNPYCTYWPEG